MVMRNAVPCGWRHHVCLPLGDVELDHVCVSVELLVFEVFLSLEQEVLHLPELSLKSGREGRACGGFTLRVRRERVALVHESHLSGMRNQDRIDERHRLATVGGFKISELHESDGRRLPARRWATLHPGKPHAPPGV